MKKLFVSVAMLGAIAAPVTAQQVGDPVTEGHASFYVSPYAGYMWFGDLFENPNGSEFTLDNGAQFGVQAGVSFSPNFSLIGNFGYNKSAFELEQTAGGTQRVSGDLGVFLYDANLQFRLPFLTGPDSWIAPFGQVGAGAIKYTFDTDDFNSDGETDVAFNFGIGGDFQFMKSIGLRIMAKDYITSLNWNDVQDVDFDADGEDNVAHNWALTVGLNFGF